MKTQNIKAMVLMAVLMGMLQASAAGAVSLRFSPEDQTIALGAEGTLSIMLDEALEVRTIQAIVTFDGEIVSSLGGGAGAAFQDLSCYVWEEFNHQENQWTGFAVSMGSDCFLVDPGELFTWSFEGINIGSSSIAAVSIILLDAQGEEISDVELPGTVIMVGEGMASVEDIGVPLLPSITASPNPFNPMTHIRFWLPESREVRLSIYDVQGRRVRQLLNGTVAAQWTSVPWNGRSDQGMDAPSGVYLYQLETRHENLTGRVTLAR